MRQMEQLGTNLYNLRKANDWSRDRVARTINDHNIEGCPELTRDIVGHIERGERVTIPMSLLVAFASMYHVTTDALLGRGCPARHPVHPNFPLYMDCRVCGAHG